MQLRKSLLISFSSNYARIGIQFVASLFIARLLTPEEFGIFSIAMVMIFVADTLRNFGVVTYIVQEKELTQTRLNAASGLNYLTSWTLAVMVYAISDLAAGFYGAEGIGEVLRLLAVNFLLLPIGAATMACMRRDLLFDRIAIIHVSHAVVGALASVTLAFAGFSYMSLAWGNLLATVTSIALVWSLKPPGLRIRPGFKEMSRVLRFGSLATTTSLVQEGNKHLPDLILGKLISVEAVAYLSRAVSLLELFRRLVLNALYNVAMPHFSKQIREARDPLPNYLLATSHVSAVGWPFYLVLALVSPLLIPFLFGDQWHAAIVPAQLLCLGELLLTPFYLMNQMLIAQGRMRFVTLFTILIALVRLPPLVILAPHGLDAAITGYAATSALVAIASYVITVRVLGCPALEFLQALKASALATLALLVCAAMGYLASLPFTVGEPVRLTIILIASSSGWLLGLRLSRHPLWQEVVNLLNRLSVR